MVGNVRQTLLPDATSPTALALLSRNASVISTSSSDEGPPITTPKARPIRQFTSPRSASPAAPASPKVRAPSYLSNQLGIANETAPSTTPVSTAKARSRSRGVNINIADFRLGETLGEGSYSTVIEGTHLSTGKRYALKILDKNFLIKKQKMSVALIEKTAMLRLETGHPGVVKLYFTFQDDSSLYFVIDLASNGEMQSLISRMGSLSLRCAQYYTAQIVDAIAFIHSKGVIHRDLKPENLLLDKDYRIRITDFGTAKILNSNVTAENFVGTAQYVAPELIQSNETTKSSDLWAIGCILYQMITGRFAFQGLSEFLIMQKVKQVDYSFPDGFDEQAKDLVQRLLVREPSERLGAGEDGSSTSMQALKNHHFFATVSWGSLWTEPPPPLASGAFKKEPLASSPVGNWQDIGARWDALIQQDDEIEWSEDHHSPHASQGSRLVRDVAIGPLGEIRASSPPPIIFPSVPPLPQEEPRDISPISSSSDEKLPVAMQSLAPFRDTSPERQRSNLSSELDAPEQERGRSQATTPIQGHGNSTDLPTRLHLSAGESVRFYSPVEIRTARRRGSKLLNISLPAVAPIKHKKRELVLTDRRLLCVKQSRKQDQSISVKLQLHLTGGEQQEIVNSVDVKGERDFVILTATGTHTFTSPDSSSASDWVRKIDEAITTRKQSSIGP